MTDYVIDVHDLRKSFGTLKVVDRLSLQVAKGEICGFLGANGSGKTTTIRILCGLLVVDGGHGTCLGLDIVRQAPLIRRQVGYMTQKFSFYDDLTVFENLDLVASLYEMPSPREAVRTIIDRIGLADRRDQLAAQLSGGWKQRLALAACILHEPQLLLLDEPTAGVDAKARREFWDLIHDMAGDGLTVLVSTHYMDEAERCNRIVYLADGRIVVQGSGEDLSRHSGLITFEATGGNIDAAARSLRRMAQFALLPSFMLSGFMFPFSGMPLWAQWVGEIFPTTHAMRIVRGVLIKGNATPDILPDLWPIALFMVAVVAIAVWCYRETLE